MAVFKTEGEASSFYTSRENFRLLIMYDIIVFDFNYSINSIMPALCIFLTLSHFLARIDAFYRIFIRHMVSRVVLNISHNLSKARTCITKTVKPCINRTSFLFQ